MTVLRSGGDAARPPARTAAGLPISRAGRSSPGRRQGRADKGVPVGGWDVDALVDFRRRSARLRTPT